MYIHCQLLVGNKCLEPFTIRYDLNDLKWENFVLIQSSCGGSGLSFRHPSSIRGVLYPLPVQLAHQYTQTTSAYPHILIYYIHRHYWSSMIHMLSWFIGYVTVVVCDYTHSIFIIASMKVVWECFMGRLASQCS